MDKEREIELLIARRVRIARQSKGLSQKQLAAAMGFKTERTISLIENANRPVKEEELLKLAISLSKPLEFFLDKYLVVEDQVFCFCQPAYR
jgi:transcriptional regulator with XRE-family HTH domain